MSDRPETKSATPAQEVDVLVIGAGLAGLYALHRLRGADLAVRVLEANDDIGGTWYSNCYPGARCDVESFEYSYGFSPELDEEWEWTERYPSQPEILRYIHHVADRFDLRRDIELRKRVTSAVFDEQASRWLIATQDGDRYSARFCVTAAGCLSRALDLPFEGLDRFEGEWYKTSDYPRDGVDFSGKRVGIIGTGSSGIQAIPVIAEQAAELLVFQRTPNFAIPGRNAPLDEESKRAIKARYPQQRQEQRYSAFGFSSYLVPNDAAILETDPEEARNELERRWALGGAANLMQSYRDVVIDQRANDIVAEYVREKIREQVEDPETAQKLLPNDHPLATKRLCVEHGYYETFNRDNVRLIDIRESPIEEITPKGVRTRDGEHALDVLVFAIGFDATTGPLLDIDFRGRGGVSLRDEWKDGPRTYLGLAMAGFPNLFTITGPGSPSLIVIVTVGIEQHVDWIADCITHLRDRDLDTIEATRAAQDQWTQHVDDVANMTLFPKANSYYMGANVPGKPRVCTIYLGGFAAYRQKCDEVAANGYEGFALSSLPAEDVGVEITPPIGGVI